MCGICVYIFSVRHRFYTTIAAQNAFRAMRKSGQIRDLHIKKREFYDISTYIYLAFESILHDNSRVERYLRNPGPSPIYIPWAQHYIYIYAGPSPIYIYIPWGVASRKIWFWISRNQVSEGASKTAISLSVFVVKFNYFGQSKAGTLLEASGCFWAYP